MNIEKKIFIFVTFLLFCNKVNVSHARASSHDFFNEYSYTGINYPVNESFFVSGPFGDSPLMSIKADADCGPGYAWDPVAGECYWVGLEPEHPDPGAVPVGGGCGFLIAAVALYGLKRFYNNKKKVK